MTSGAGSHAVCWRPVPPFADEASLQWPRPAEGTTKGLIDMGVAKRSGREERDSSRRGHGDARKRPQGRGETDEPGAQDEICADEVEPDRPATPDALEGSTLSVGAAVAGVMPVGEDRPARPEPDERDIDAPVKPPPRSCGS